MVSQRKLLLYKTLPFVILTLVHLHTLFFLQPFHPLIPFFSLIFLHQFLSVLLISVTAHRRHWSDVYGGRCCIFQCGTWSGAMYTEIKMSAVTWSETWFENVNHFDVIIKNFSWFFSNKTKNIIKLTVEQKTAAVLDQIHSKKKNPSKLTVNRFINQITESDLSCSTQLVFSNFVKEEKRGTRVKEEERDLMNKKQTGKKEKWCTESPKKSGIVLKECHQV